MHIAVDTHCCCNTYKMPDVNVRLNIYDLSRGLAREYSQTLLGRQVWLIDRVACINHAVAYNSIIHG